MIEIKLPHDKLINTKKENKIVYERNHLNISRTSKMASSKTYCEDNGLKFKIITEKELGQY